MKKRFSDIIAETIVSADVTAGAGESYGTGAFAKAFERWKKKKKKKRKWVLRGDKKLRGGYRSHYLA